MDPSALWSEIEIGGLLGDGPPFLAQLTVGRTHLDCFGVERRVTLSAAGCGMDATTATARCRGEMVERLVASSPAAVHRTVIEQREAPCYERRTWRAFCSYDPGTAERLAREAPLDGEFVCVARGLASGGAVLVPASRVILHWGQFVGEQGVAGECDATGLAAGADVADAVSRGLREVLERHAVMGAWRHAWWPGHPVDVAVIATPLAAWLEASPNRLRLVDVAPPGLDPVVIALLHDRAGATVGSACTADLADAVESAVLEAAILRSTIDVLGAGSPAVPIESSLDHVRFGFQNPALLHRWIDRLDSAPQVPVDEDRPLVDRVADRFGDEPLAVVLADSGDAPLAVVRVLLAGAMRKEWCHDLRWRNYFAAHGAGHRACHDLPHPFG